ncbi:2-phospho-L-lactate guanylyltransferase [Oerskovia flava]|uniref:2-phospho-L-lactate guanylyltransferase n=1 Tax=Oerskovia flava TaxID=2986422 RepID=UPI0022406FE4|nr:2-phospho-L-lactate guanylyltransferase [Oerskovia sp. JB1-3-2]
MTERVVAVVPLRDGASGKSRLANVLDPAARSRLIGVLARHVVQVLLEVEQVDQVVVVTGDPRFAWRALHDLVVEPAAGSAGSRDGAGAGQGDDGRDVLPTLTARADRLRIVLQPADRPGLNTALDVARELVADDGGVRLLVAHADLPALSPADVVAVLAEDAPVVVATDRHRSGTNLLALEPPLSSPSSTTLLPSPPGERQQGRVRQGVFQFRFGVGSLGAHLREAERLSVRAVVVHQPGTATDLDTLEDWDELPADVRRRMTSAVPSLPTDSPQGSPAPDGSTL